MRYEKPILIIYDEEVMEEIELAASSTCHCTQSGARVTCKTGDDGLELI